MVDAISSFAKLEEANEPKLSKDDTCLLQLNLIFLSYWTGDNITQLAGKPIFDFFSWLV